MSIFDVQNNQNYYIDYVDNELSVINNLSILRLSAYKNELGEAKNLFIGASSNLVIEASESLKTYVGETGIVQLHATTLSNSQRHDEEYLSFYYDSNLATTVIEANNNKKVSIKSTDIDLTAEISGMTFCNDSSHQFISSIGSKGLHILGPGAQLENLWAHNHVFGKQLHVLDRFETSNVGDFVEAGYTMQMNNMLQLEIIRYGKVITPSGHKKVYQKVGIFGGKGFSSSNNTDSNLQNDDPFADLSLLSGSSTPTAISLGTVYLTNNTRTFNLSNYFTNSVSGSLVYTVTSDPYLNTSITSNTLSIIGNYRNTTYTVTVRATNAYNSYVESSLTVVEVSSTTRSYPPITLTSTTTNVANEVYGNGTYVVAASSGINLAPQPYDGNNSTYYISDGHYTFMTGAYVGSTNTVVDGVSVSGEWYQILLPLNILLHSYVIGAVDAAYSPDSWIFAGSTDGTTWVSIDDKAAGSGSAITSFNNTTFNVSVNQMYNYYRLICRKTKGQLYFALGTFQIIAY